MENQYNQLRFDISEKVSLHPQQLGIVRVLELDLFPDVQILDEGHHVRIQGYLRLNGSYVGESDDSEVSIAEEPEGISYVIPVEITLPADRADIGNVSAEVESFDYQIMSPFELQIEAILFIDGVSSGKHSPQTHQEDEMLEENQPFFQAQSGQSEREVSEEDNFSEQELFTHYHPDIEDRQNPYELEREASRSRYRNERRPTMQPEYEPEEEYIYPFPDEARQPELERRFAANDLEMMDGRGDPDLGPDEFELDESEKNVNEWSYWLVGKKPETFTAMRLVIIQKEESVDSLADRYQVSSSRIKHCNHLNSEQLEEGQIVCIPSTD
ncbi:stage VI sporulation protein D [Croceifilum oryzae]|uniref:Stage VI sporulation protein D n=1 Tax=Croceifilum oryzae TaxID=1553429 RepID=A0AAJ1WSS2_9BACL|nr:LysM peptidoglycan-binding domain-containing protein [Croceifilum oryzae]MDQ0417268.1 stage VI sporulation protein D [Croceifilum oryzae]